ncbi:MAG: M3 family metallopeptidase [Bacteroidaceae bacterium]|nr:M3 family metallopeptidase [Bacteroidaceae bacterium]
MNPFFLTYEYIPFDLIKTEHYEPAILQGIKEECEDIDAIVNNPEAPTFENTIVALEHTGALLERVTTVMYNQLSAHTSDELEELAQKMSPVLSEHSSNIMLNPELYKRVKAVKEGDLSGLNHEDLMLLDKTYEGFERSGANLSDEDKVRFREIKNELSVLTLQFSQNVLKETNDFVLHVTKEEDLAGLPESQKQQAKQTAEERNMEGWAFTLHAPSYVPFMQYADNRVLREALYRAYNTRATHDNEHNNFEVVKRLVNLRRELAQLLGYATYADYALKRRMASEPKNVEQLLDQLIEAYSEKAHEEVAEVFALAPENERQAWDFSYYAHKLKQRNYDIESEMLRPYFELSKVKAGVFGLANRLYGITFERVSHVPTYHPDVEVFDVKDEHGEPLALLYTDFHPRASKQGGAWMTSYREQREGVRPQVAIVMNFTNPTHDKPALLTHEELETFLHEFGHALHGMFANTKYAALSGTNVYWDFVELPSQFMENYAVEPEFLTTFATHYETGETIPQELIVKLQKSRNFNAAYACMRQVSFGLLDMAYYTQTTPFKADVKTFEQEAWKRATLLPYCDGACMSVQFGHIMSGGYAAGYYSYKWAEVLDADAFDYFKQNGIFNVEVARRFRTEVLSRGGTVHPQLLYRNFRGQDATIDALLTRNEIIKPKKHV